MSSTLRGDLQKIFAILPESRINDAVEATLLRLKEESDLSRTPLKWADFSDKGVFLRGGVSDLFDYAVRLLSRPDQDADIAVMAREAAEGSAVPGRVISSPDRQSFILFLPDTTSSVDSPAVARIRGFLVTEAVFRRVHLRFNSDNRLTEAELRVAFQVLAGLPLREAASIDGVKVGTKRAQVKSITAKMQCAGQADLVRLLTGQISVLRSLADDEAKHAAFAETFVTSHLGEGTSLTVERLPDGRLIRCIEAGAKDGHPVIAGHGMMFGMLVAAAGPILRGLGLRLLIPIRSGYLDPRPVLDLTGGDSRKDSVSSELALFIERRRLAPATVLGHSLGAVHALHLAKEAPALVARLILLSPNTAATNARGNSFTDGLYEGYRREHQLSRAITFEFSRHYPDEEASRTILWRMFTKSRADVAALAGETHVPPVERWFPPLYRSSVAGIAEDYDVALSEKDWDSLSAFDSLCIHGTNDPLMPIANVAAKLQTLPSAQFVRVEGAGHFAVASHAIEVWQSIAKFISDCVKRQ
jgi:pimeloyl-ACP methyl ester carboxylesterase/DNA-binding CsgD family transcriptional regulator